MRLCRCVVLKEFATRMDQAWKGISKAPMVPSSPLLPYVDQDVWVTGSEPWLKAQLRHIAYRQPFRWSFRRTTDAGLLTAWLATAASDGAKIYDMDVARSIEEGERRERPSFAYMTLTDIATPSDLLVIQLGVKTTPNREMANTLLECIRERQSVGRATWVWDQLDRPLNDEAHRCYSFEVVDELSSWARVVETQEIGPTPHVASKVRSLFHQPPIQNIDTIVVPPSEEENPLAAFLSRSDDDGTHKRKKERKKGGFR